MNNDNDLDLHLHDQMSAGFATGDTLAPFCFFLNKCLHLYLAYQEPYLYVTHFNSIEICQIPALDKQG